MGSDPVTVIAVPHVLKESYWASEIEWPVVRHSRDKKKIRDVLKV
jgi:hypothetical protein